MKRFHFEPTSYCQLRCELCPSVNFDDKRKGFMDFSSFKKLINESAAVGLMKENDEIHLYGFGEPTLHKKLDDMIRVANEKGMTTKIDTNGLALKPELWDRIVGAGLRECLVSVDGLDQETYQRYRTLGNFEQLRKNIEYICSHSSSVQIELQFIVFSYNAHQLEQFIRFSEEVGAHIATIKKPRVWDGSKEGFEGMKNLPPEYVRNYNNSNCRFSDGYGLVLQNGVLTICTADAFGIHSIGNIFETGPSLWESKSFKELKFKSKTEGLEICRKCGYADSYAKKIRLK